MRRDLLRLLLEGGPQAVQELAVHFDLSRPSVSEHLKVLLDAGLVAERKSGRKRYYRLEPAPLMELHDWLEPYERFWRRGLAEFADLLDERERHDNHDRGQWPP